MPDTRASVTVPLQSRGCQLMTNADAGHLSLRWCLRFRVRRVRKWVALRTRLKRVLRSWRPYGGEWPARPGAAPGAAMSGPLARGDCVRVRTLPQIRASLDADGRCGGCAFLEPMARYCGREFHVARRVERFFDEARWRMLQCRGVVLLEGVYCDGTGHPDTRGCDRMCFFFWRTEWLERVFPPPDDGLSRVSSTDGPVAPQ